MFCALQMISSGPVVYYDEKISFSSAALLNAAASFHDFGFLMRCLVDTSRPEGKKVNFLARQKLRFPLRKFEPYFQVYFMKLNFNSLKCPIARIDFKTTKNATAYEKNGGGH
jgi:hypothetical protein